MSRSSACWLAVWPWRAADPLPSWNDGPTKQAILAFVAGAIDQSSPNFIAPEDRIATFDNDGTLWCEQPVVELAFTEGKLKELAAKDPTLKEKQPFKAALEHDRAYQPNYCPGSRHLPSR